jgi:hypothetical protein
MGQNLNYFELLKPLCIITLLSRLALFTHCIQWMSLIMKTPESLPLCEGVFCYLGFAAANH